MMCDPTKTAYLMAVAADDLSSVMEKMVANAFGAGLGGPEGPEPDKPSPRYRAPSLSQVSTKGTGAAQEAARRNHG